MKANDLIVGNKYVPHSKYGERSKLADSVIWNSRGGKEQGFIYYTGYENRSHAFATEYEGKHSGDFFDPCDVTPYEEFTLPKIWCTKITDENRSVLKQYWEKQAYDHTYEFRGFLMSHGCWDNSGLNYNTVADYIDAYPLTFEQFKTYVMKEEEFVLPEKWFVTRTEENYKVINDWFTENQSRDWGYMNPLGPVFSETLHGNWFTSKQPKAKEHAEITFEQFKKYILNTNKVMSKKLIGYNLKPEFKNMQNAASYIAFQNGGWTNENPQFSIGYRDDQIIRLSQANVLDLWFDKVYKKENRKETYHLGDKAILVTFKEDGIFADGKKFDIQPFKELIHKTNINGYSFVITEFQIGCTTVKREQLQDLLDRADRFYRK
jgi:hypothetical protein